MQSRTPSFLLGGINLAYNLIGKRTITTGAWGAFETGVKLSPILMIFTGAGMAQGKQMSLNDAAQVPEAAAPAEERRSTLTQ